MNIGNWVRRKGKWHLVESVIDGDAVTRCGKRMADWPGSHGREKLQVSEVMPLTRMIGQLQLCKAGCDDTEDARVQRALGESSEDDGSTQPEMVP